MTKNEVVGLNANTSKMGFGLAALGRPGYINLGHGEDIGKDKNIDSMRAHTFNVLDAAWAAGIRYFDAARSYGKAEEFLGNWLHERGVGPHEVIVSSKWGYYYTAGWQVKADKHEIKEHSAELLDQQINESREQLGNYLQLYQIHSATQASGVLGNKKVLDRLSQLKSQGLKLGLTVSGPGQSDTISQALEIKHKDQLLFNAVQATWNLLETSAAPALEAAHRAGMLVIVKEALANGRLTERNEEPEFEPKRRILKALATEHISGMDAIALAAALAKPWSDIVLSGAATVDHLNANIKALKIDLKIQELDKLEGLAEPRRAYWQHRSELEWN